MNKLKVGLFSSALFKDSKTLAFLMKIKSRTKNFLCNCCLFPVDQAVLDDALMPSVLPLVKKEDTTPMEVSSLQSASVFKVTF